MPGGSMTNGNGVKLEVGDCIAGSANQRFQIVGSQIKLAGTSKCLDLTDGKSTSGNPVRFSVGSTRWIAC
jgi:hypothetical protein